VLGLDREVRVLVGDRLVGWGDVVVQTVPTPSQFCIATVQRKAKDWE
jgi:hypothetical protein